jgi:hypothetical protein
MLTWTGLLLVGTLYIVAVFGPLGLFAPSAASWLMLDISTLTLVGDTDVTRGVLARAPIDGKRRARLPRIAAGPDAFAFSRIC